MIPHINNNKKIKEREEESSSNFKTQEYLLKEFLKTDIGINSLKMAFENLKTSPLATKDLVNEIEDWAQKTLVSRGAVFYSWDTNQCWAHFSKYWLPRIRRNESSSNYEPKVQNINEYRQQAAKYANY